ncbi:hypothetical protein [Prescottella equi]|uniref:hypothetical protein n=1 Tax=Rhodococcus hoagii TaxID=43767 RepID=UPI001C844C7D|nr:hypothetical protein [Prescottella equi]
MTRPSRNTSAALQLISDPVDAPLDPALPFLASCLGPGTLEAVRRIAPHVLESDFGDPRDRIIWGAITALSRDGASPTGQLVDGHLRRDGVYEFAPGQKLLARRLVDVSSCRDGHPALLERLAADLLGLSFRRTVAEVGSGQAESALTSSESDLWEHVKSGGANIRRIHERLSELRKTVPA